MIVDVTWNGMTLARGAQARTEPNGWFVELEQPMPVGTTLALAGEAQATVRVAKVHEGLGAGMWVKALAPVDGGAKPEPEKQAAAEIADEKEGNGHANGNGNGHANGDGQANGNGKRKRRSKRGA
jgi:hypothetical protein